MKSRVYLNSAFLLRAAIGFSRHLTSAGEDSYSFNLYSIVCRISCTYFHLIHGFRFFSQKTSASMSLLLPVSSKNEGNLEVAPFQKSPACNAICPHSPPSPLILLCHKFLLWLLRMRRTQCGHR